VSDQPLSSGVQWRYRDPFRQELRRHIRNLEPLIEDERGDRHLAIEFGSIVVGSVTEVDDDIYFIVSVKARVMPDYYSVDFWLRFVIRKKRLPGLKPFPVADVYYMDENDDMETYFSVVDGSYFDKWSDD